MSQVGNENRNFSAAELTAAAVVPVGTLLLVVLAIWISQRVSRLRQYAVEQSDVETPFQSMFKSKTCKDDPMPDTPVPLRASIDHAPTAGPDTTLVLTDIMVCRCRVLHDA